MDMDVLRRLSWLGISSVSFDNDLREERYGGPGQSRVFAQGGVSTISGEFRCDPARLETLVALVDVAQRIDPTCWEEAIRAAGAAAMLAEGGG